MHIAMDFFDDIIEPTELTIYVGALAVSGVLLLLLAGIGFGTSGATRAINAIIGLACLGYGVYLQFFTKEGDTVWVSFYVFILPILLLINAFRGRKSKSEASTPSA
jgi:drug/metabolite transporter (DMT)-like permease